VSQPAAVLESRNSVVDPYRHFLEVLGRDHRLICTKCYRVDLSGEPLPCIPCLDHEAQLQGNPAPHISVYLEDSGGYLHEVGIVPDERRILIDAASTIAETPPLAREQMLLRLKRLFPDYRVGVQRPSVWRGDVRVATVVRTQMRLRDVLLGDNGAEVRFQLERLRAIAELMEKESRVSSWGIRTLTSPLLAAAGVASYKVLGLFDSHLSSDQIEVARYLALLSLGGGFLWIGMKAVHLTEMGTRVWKKATEYRLILEARARWAQEKRAAG
jgi:hypothetical protein